MNATEPPVVAGPPPADRDRRGGLIVFGVFEILGGAFFAFSLPMMVLGEFLTSRQQARPFDLAALAPIIVMYLVLAVGLVCLGIGSIRGRRWARALLLVLGWVALAGGSVALIVIATSLDGFEELVRQQTRQQGGQEMPAIAMTIMKAIMITSMLVFYVVIPGALVLFYRSPHVKRTCERLDPVERWTDRAPLPIIGACALMVFGAVAMLFTPQFGGVMPLFGEAITGWPARLLWLGFAAISLYAARGFYRLDYRAWKIYLAFVIFCAVNYAASLSMLGFEAYFAATGVSGWQLDQIKGNPLFERLAGWMPLVAMVPFTGFVLYLRRYFVAAKDRPAAA
jgi:hypothetical protein